MARASSFLRRAAGDRAARRSGSARVAFVVLAIVALGVLWILNVGSREDAAVAPGSNRRASVDVPDLAWADIAAPDPLAAVPRERGGSRTPESPTATAALADGIVRVLVWVNRGMDPLADMNVDLALAPDGAELSAPAVVSGRTDANGRLQLDVDWSLVLAARKEMLRLVTRLRQPGWQFSANTRDLPNSPRQLDVMLVAQPGGTITGRVVDAHGEGVATAVRVIPSVRSVGDATPPAVTSNGFGWFALHLRSEGTYDFTAEAEGLGTAEVRDRGVQFTDPPQSLELRLAGAGRMRGHVRDLRGRPAAGLRLLLELAEIAESTESSDSPARSERVREIRRRAAGLLNATTVTSSEGTFDVLGLRAERYVLRAKMPGALAPPMVELTPAPVFADGRELELVFDRPHIAVRVVDPSGNPWVDSSWDQLSHAPTGALRWEPDQGWPDEPRVRVVPIQFVDPSLDSQANVSSGTVARHEWVYEVTAGHTYDVLLEGGDLASDARRVLVPADAGRIDVQLVATKREVGRVVLDLFDVTGAPTQEALAVQLEDPETRAIVLYLDLRAASSEPWQRVFEAPAGTWRLVIGGRDPYRDVHARDGSAPRVLSTLGRAETPIVVRSGEDTPVSLRIPAAARLRLSLRGEKQAEKVPPTDSAWPWPGSKVWFPGGVSVALVHATRGSVPVSFEPIDENDVPRGFHGDPYSYVPAPQLGQTKTSLALPAGEYTLDVRLDDGRRAAKPVVLVEGQTTDVTVEF
jgi:hypothetical protein